MKRNLFLSHIKEDQLWAGDGLQGNLRGSYCPAALLASKTKGGTQGEADFSCILTSRYEGRESWVSGSFLKDTSNTFPCMLLVKAMAKMAALHSCKKS